MEYTEAIKKEADEVVMKYRRIIHLDVEYATLCAIQDRQSVLDNLYKIGCPSCQSKHQELTESLTKQISYLISKL